MKVYVVTEGEYSAFHIEAVFSTRELADAFVRDYFDHDDEYFSASVEEYEMDVNAGKERTFRQLYQAAIHLPDGKAETPRPWSRSDELPESDYWISKEGDYGFATGWSFESLEHAHKLAVEQYQKFLRERASSLCP